MLSCEALAIADVKLLRPQRHGDARGFFLETFRASALSALGLPTSFPQDNCSFSGTAGVLRGLHFQAPPAAQGKLIRVSRGAIFDVAVDLRVGSTTYGKHVSAVLSAEEGAQIWVPEGFAHGFMTLKPDTEVNYKITAEYAPASEGGLLWSDGELGIPWPQPPTLVSEKDEKWPPLRAFVSPFR